MTVFRFSTVTEARVFADQARAAVLTDNVRVQCFDVSVRIVRG